MLTETPLQHVSNPTSAAPAATRSREEIAREILGDAFITPEEVAKTGLVVDYPREVLAHLMNTIPGDGTLAWFKRNGYVLVPGPETDLPLIQVRNLGREYFAGQALGEVLNISRYVNSAAGRGWQAIRAAAVPDTHGYSWNTQLRLLHSGESVPGIARLLWTMIVCRAVRDRKLFAGYWVRCNNSYYEERDPRSNRVLYTQHPIVATFDDGINVDIQWDNQHIPHIALPGCRNL